MDANTTQTALSWADYSVLLPLHKHIQVLVIDTEEYRFLPQLVDYAKCIDVLVNESNETFWLDILKTLELPGVYPIKRVTKQYDLVFSDTVQQLPVGKGGTVCRFFRQRSVLLEETPLRRYGAWFAWPDWPTLRFLIPDSPQGMLAAVHQVPLSSNSSLIRLVSRWLPSWISALVGNQGIILYRDGEKPAYPSYWEQLVEALSVRADFYFLKTVPAERCLIDLGIPENPHIVFTVVDEKGCAQGLIKCARLPDQSLSLEEKRWETIVNLLGSDLADKLIIPTMMTLDGRVVSAYRMHSPGVDVGSHWRLRTRRNFIWAITHWLIKVAYKTAHPLPVSQFWEKHGLPLANLQRQKNVLPLPLKKAVDQALITLEKSSFRAFSVLEHGHLSIHNVQSTSKDGRNFRIKDWEYVDFDGAPLVDLCHFLASCNAPPKLAVQCMGAYLEQTGYSQTMVLPLWLSYIARRWQSEDDLGIGREIFFNHKNLLRMTGLVHSYAQVLERKAL